MDTQMMTRALKLAAKAKGLTRPNPAVGAVIADGEGNVLGEGFHHQAGQPHGEREALADATRRGNNVHGATMYITLEPCNHTGRTGPCTEAIIEAGIARVVIAMEDPHAVASGGIQRLRDAGIEVQTGVCRQEAYLLNDAFNTYHLTGRPLITVKWAMTLDGCTSVPSGDSKWITGPEAREEVHRRRAAHDAVMAGKSTVLKDEARLSVRLSEEEEHRLMPKGFRPVRVVLDTELRLSPQAAFVHVNDGSKALIFCAEDADQGREKALLDHGADVIRVMRGDGGVSLDAVMLELYKQEIQSVYLEGGRTVAGRLFEEGLVDRVEAWIAPRVAGGGEFHLGPLARPRPLEEMAGATNLHHITFNQFGPDFLMEGWVTHQLFG